MATHLHTYELGDTLLPVTAGDSGAGHTHKTILPDGTVIETSPPLPDVDGPHVHTVDVRGAQIGTSDAVSPAEYLAAAAKAMKKRGRRMAQTPLTLAQFLAQPVKTGNKPPYMIAPDAPRVWVDAVKTGQLAGYPSEDGEGIAITEEMIDEMVANLARSADPIPVDGAGVSKVHGTPEDTGTEAAGWAFEAKKIAGDDGLTHMHLWLELRPEVHAKMERGGLKFGSIAFAEESIDRETGRDVGAVLDSYALTNKPFVQGLKPHMLLSTPPNDAARVCRLSQSREVCMSKEETVSLASLPQVQKALLEVFEIGPDTPPGELGEKLLMKAVEWKAKGGGSFDGPPKPAPKGELADPPADPAKLADPAATGVAEQVLGMLMEAFALPPEAPPEALLELLAANLDAIKAAVAGAPAAAPDAGPGDQPTEPPTLSEDSPRVVALEAALKGVTDKLDAEQARREKDDATAYVTKEFSDRGLDLDDSARETMVTVCLSQGRPAIDAALKGIKPQPPKGRVTSPTHTPRVSTLSVGDGTAAVTTAKDEVRAAHPDWSEKKITRAAITLAAKRNPDMVRAL